MNDQQNQTGGTDLPETKRESKTEKRLEKRAIRDAARSRAQRKSGGKKVALWIVLIAIIAGGLIVGFRDKGANTGNGDTEGVTIEITEADHVSGPSDAAVTLVEFADFQCPACAAYHPLVQQLKEQFPDNLRVVFKHFPLSQIHPNALPAGLATEAAGRQDKFWEMHDLLFERQADWSGALNAVDIFKGYAEELALDVAQFESDLQDTELRDIVLGGVVEGSRVGVRGTPTFFVNNVKIENPRSLEGFAEIINDELARVIETIIEE